MEIEAKYRIASQEVHTELKAISKIGEYALRPGHLVSFRDTYYDTEDNHFMTAGFACRLRQNGDINELSLKSLTPTENQVHTREEISIQVPAIRIEEPVSWPDNELMHQIWRITGGRPLKPLFELHQDRYVRVVIYQEIELAELCLDSMRCHHEGMELAYLGLEIELKPRGTQTELAEICQKLEQGFDLLPEKRSKFEIGLAFTQVPSFLVTGAPPAEPQSLTISPDNSMANATRKIIQYHMEVMKQNDGGSYQGEDIEYVHDMRVAIRRMRTACRVLKPYLKKVALKPYLEVLKKTGRILGDVRDLDVFRENFTLFTIENQIDAVSSTLNTAWNSAYILARNCLLEHLVSEPYLSFRDNFEKNLPLLVKKRASVARQIWGILDEQEKLVLSHVQQMTQSPPIPLHAYHQLRIYIKYFRYSVEYFRNILGEQGEEVIAETKIIHDHLGFLQDAVVARQRIRSVLHWGSWYPPRQPYTLVPTIHKPSPDVIQYLAHTEDTIVQLIDAFPEAWERFSDFLRSATYKKAPNTL
jgi:triphosphatase